MSERGPESRRRRRKKKRKRAVSGRRHISLYLTPLRSGVAQEHEHTWQEQDEDEEAFAQWDDMLPEYPTYSSLEVLREQSVIERSPIMVMFMYLDIVFKNDVTMFALVEEETIHMLLVDMLMLMEDMQLRYLALCYAFFSQDVPYAAKLLPRHMYPPGFSEVNADTEFPPISLELLDANKRVILGAIRDAADMDDDAFDRYVEDLVTW